MQGTHTMLKYQNILLSTDLSEHAELVAKQARELANDCNATLHVVHIMEHSPIAYGGEFSIPIDINLEQTLEKFAIESLQKLADKFEISPDNTHIKKGSVKLVVNELANNIKADLIVVGTHGHHGLDVLLGSRANAILHFAKCDVMIIRIPKENNE